MPKRKSKKNKSKTTSSSSSCTHQDESSSEWCSEDYHQELAETAAREMLDTFCEVRVDKETGNAVCHATMLYLARILCDVTQNFTRKCDRCDFFFSFGTRAMQLFDQRFATDLDPSNCPRVDCNVCSNRLLPEQQREVE